MKGVYKFTFFNEFWMMYSVYNSLFSSFGVGIGKVAFLFVMSQFGKIVLDILIGFIYPKCNRKLAFSFMCLCRIAAIVIWMTNPSYFMLCISMFLVGIHISGFYHHFEGYLYDLTKANSKLKYEDVLGRYYSVMNIGLLFANIAISFDRFEISTILIFQLILSISAFALSALCLKSSKIIDSNANNNLSPLKLIKLCISGDKINSLLILAISEALFMNLTNMSSSILSAFGDFTYVARVMLVIAFIKIPLNFFAGRLKISNPVYFNIYAILLCIPFFVFFESLGHIGFGIYLILYSIGIIHIIGVFQKSFQPIERMGAISFGTIGISLITILFDISIGFLGAKSGVIFNMSVASIAMIIIEKRRVKHLVA